MSMTDINETVGTEGCFQAASRRLRKRKHSDSEENDFKPQKQSIFASIGEKLGFLKSSRTTRTSSRHSESKKSILTPRNSQIEVVRGELNFSFEHDQSPVTNKQQQHDYDEQDFPPRKRVKFDEENVIVSSITYQRRQSQIQLDRLRETEKESILTKFVNFTANLF